MNKVILFLMMVLATPAWAENEVWGEKSINGWNISSIGKVGTEDFTHCVATINFEARTSSERKEMQGQGISMMFKLHDPDMYSFSIGGDWNIKSGGNYDLGFTFSDEGVINRFSRNAVGGNEGKYVTILENTDKNDGGEFFVLVAAADWMKIEIDGHYLGRYNLSGSRKALETLMECYMGAKNYEMDSLNRGTFGGGKAE